MVRQAQIPGRVYVNETGTRQAQIPATVFINETVATASGITQTDVAVASDEPSVAITAARAGDETVSSNDEASGVGIFALSRAESGSVGDEPNGLLIAVAGASEEAATGEGLLSMQRLQPASDVSSGGWTASTGSDLYAMLDELDEDDADFIRSSDNPTDDVCEVKLAAGVTPIVGVPHIVSYALENVGTVSSCVVSYRCGDTEIAAWTHVTLIGGPTRFDQQVTAEQAATITDPTDMRLRFTATLFS